MSYSKRTKTKIWMPIKDTKCYKQIGPYSGMAILETKEGDVCIRIRGLPNQLDFNFDNIQKAKEAFNILSKFFDERNFK
jgi:hypothetical protein